MCKLCNNRTYFRLLEEEDQLPKYFSCECQGHARNQEELNSLRENLKTFERKERAVVLGIDLQSRQIKWIGDEVQLSDS